VNSGWLIVALLAVAAGIGCYVLSLTVRWRRLQRRLEELAPSESPQRQAPRG
jgi:CcmD family protein